MWLYLNNSFLSIVKPQGNKPGVLLVRTRIKQDLERAFPDAKIMETPLRDYPYRAFVSTKRVQEVMANQILRIEYDNFKQSVQDNHRHDVYTRVWAATRALKFDESEE